MSMNLDRHIKAQIDLFCHLANGDDEKAEAIRSFYDEYCAVMDLPAEFYLQTVRTVFREHALPLGKFEWHGCLIECGVPTLTLSILIIRCFVAMQ